MAAAVKSRKSKDEPDQMYLAEEMRPPKIEEIDVLVEGWLDKLWSAMHRKDGAGKPPNRKVHGLDGRG